MNSTPRWEQNNQGEARAVVLQQGQVFTCRALNKMHLNAWFCLQDWKVLRLLFNSNYLFLNSLWCMFVSGQVRKEQQTLTCYVPALLASYLPLSCCCSMRCSHSSAGRNSHWALGPHLLLWAMVSMESLLRAPHGNKTIVAAPLKTHRPFRMSSFPAGAEFIPPGLLRERSGTWVWRRSRSCSAACGRKHPGGFVCLVAAQRRRHRGWQHGGGTGNRR